MQRDRDITESLSLLFAEKEIAELRAKMTKLETELEAARAENQSFRDLLVEKSKRIRELESNLLKFVEDFLQGNEPSGSKNISRTTQTRSKRNTKTGKRDQYHQSYPLVLYFIYCEPAQAVKIGYTSDIQSRASNLQVGNPFKLSLVGCIPIPDISWEPRAHKIFDPFWIAGEWFSINSEILSWIKVVVSEMVNIKPRLSKPELEEILSTWINSLDESIQSILNTKDSEELKRKCKQDKLILLVDRADKYLMALPESNQKQKSLKPSKR